MSTRREFLIRGAALATAAAAGSAGAGDVKHDFTDEDYRRAFVIDGMGGVDDPYSPPEATVLDPRADQKKFYEERAQQGIAAPGEGPEIFNIVPEWDDIKRYRHLADGLSKAGWTVGQIEKALGANLLRVYGDTFG